MATANTLLTIANMNTFSDVYLQIAGALCGIIKAVRELYLPPTWKNNFNVDGLDYPESNARPNAKGHSVLSKGYH